MGDAEGLVRDASAPRLGGVRPRVANHRALGHRVPRVCDQARPRKKKGHIGPAGDPRPERTGIPCGGNAPPPEASTSCRYMLTKQAGRGAPDQETAEHLQADDLQLLRRVSSQESVMESEVPPPTKSMSCLGNVA